MVQNGSGGAPPATPGAPGAGAIPQRKPAIQRTPIDDVHLDELLETVVENNASDLHMCTGLPPVMRVDGELKAMRYTPLSPEVSQRLIYDILTDDQIQRLETDLELDCARWLASASTCSRTAARSRRRCV